LKPPSSATSRAEIPSRSSSLIVWGSGVFSFGFPLAVVAAKINPRSPRFVFSVTSAI
jgi:hypothetical protein